MLYITFQKMSLYRVCFQYVCFLLSWFLANADFEPNMRLNGHVYKIFNAMGKKSCMSECFRRSTCLSFNYDRVTFRCLVNDVDKSADPGNFVAHEGFLYGEKSDLNMEINGPCRNVSCPEEKMCVVLHNFKPVCIRTGCSSPPVVENSIGIKVRKEHQVSTNNNYKCDRGYKLEGDPTITCIANGTWTTPTFQCNDCGNPPTVRNAQVPNVKTTIGSVVTYTCINSTLIGANAAICQFDLSWFVHPFGCVPTISSCGTPEYAYNSTLRLCYKKVDNSPKSWQNAMNDCFEDNSRLIQLETQEKLDFISPLLDVNQHYFIGAHDVGHTGNFTWMDGQRVANHTRPTSGPENYVMMLMYTGFLSGRHNFNMSSEHWTFAERRYICGHVS